MSIRSVKVFAGMGLLIATIITGAHAGTRSKPAVRRPEAPARDPHRAGFVAARELADGDVPPPDADGNFIVGPTHRPAPEMTSHEGVPKGTLFNFTMKSSDSRIYPGIARDPDTYGTRDPN